MRKRIGRTWIVCLRPWDVYGRQEFHSIGDSYMVTNIDAGYLCPRILLSGRDFGLSPDSRCLEAPLSPTLLRIMNSLGATFLWTKNLLPRTLKGEIVLEPGLEPTRSPT